MRKASRLQPSIYQRQGKVLTGSPAAVAQPILQLSGIGGQFQIGGRGRRFLDMIHSGKGGNRVDCSRSTGSGRRLTLGPSHPLL
jgi:hypothetical protein